MPGGYQNIPPPSYNAPPPPLPSIPPAGLPTAPPTGPHDEHIYDNPRPIQPGAGHPPQAPDGLPDLPSVPINSLPPGGASAGGEDVDFDELTKRFEDLKKRK